MRPDVALVPVPGSSVPVGPAMFSWTAPVGTIGAIALAGTSAGDCDVLARTALAPGAPISLTVPTGSRRLYLSLLVDAGASSYAYFPVYSVSGAPIPPETVYRRLLATYFLEAWLDCPVALPGEVSFDAENAEDVAPWTVDQVRSTVGYVVLRFRELARADDGLTATSEGPPGSERIVSGEFIQVALDFIVLLPSKASDTTTTAELRRFEIESLFKGLAIYPEGTDVLSIRNHARFPTVKREGADDGTWRRSYLTVQVQIRVRRPHAGAQEVALP